MEDEREIKIELSDKQLFHLIRLEKKMLKKAAQLKFPMTKKQIHKLALDTLGYSKHEIIRSQEFNEHSVFKNALKGQYEQM
jgi:hypothetical protein